MAVSINNHSLWVYEIDGQYIVPQKVDVSTLLSGRTSITSLEHPADLEPVLGVYYSKWSSLFLSGPVKQYRR